MAQHQGMSWSMRAWGQPRAGARPALALVVAYLGAGAAGTLTARTWEDIPRVIPFRQCLLGFCSL